MGRLGRDEGQGASQSLTNGASPHPRDAEPHSVPCGVAFLEGLVTWQDRKKDIPLEPEGEGSRRGLHGVPHTHLPQAPQAAAPDGHPAQWGLSREVSALWGE